jgi:branched-chain amino acid transport system substrate-binding protein
MGSPAVKLVILEINDGTFSRGFDVTARIIVDRRSEQIFKAQLPAAPDLPHLYDQWQASYRALGNATLISVSTTQVTNLSIIGDCTHLSAELKQRFNQWLNSDSFRTLERSLLLAIGSSDSVRFMVQTLDRYLRRLPWQTWDLFEQHYPTAEVMLSHPITPPSKPFNAPVRILAVEGNTDGTKACLDLTQLNRLPQTHITVLHQPTSSELIDRLWHEDWDMFFFLGHSDSTDDDQNGQILLNATETVTLSEIHHALKNALKNGLKLAIFNSCNGLGLAQRLADLNIPYVIVMRERVPDQVALEFFKTFLTSFSQGKVLHSALHIARQKLAGYGDRYPCAHWLPVLCQNPNAPELRYPKSKKPYRRAIAIGLAFTSLTGLWILWPTLSKWYDNERQFSERSSLGAVQLDLGIASQHKTNGIEAFKHRNFDRAEKEFRESLRHEPNDPETRIYLNNSETARDSDKAIIVVSVPLKTNPYVGREILRGVAQIQTQFNGEFKGRSLEVIIGSDDNDELIAENLASHWVTNKNILAVIGHNAGNASIPASKIYEKGSLPMITPTTYVTSPESLKYSFHMVTDPSYMAGILADYASVNFSGQKIASCVDERSQDNTQFGEAFKVALRGSPSIEYINEKISDTCLTNKKDAKASEQVQFLVKKGVKVLVIAPFINDLGKSFKIAKEARKAGLKILGTPSFYTEETLKTPTMEGIAFPVAWMPNLPENLALLPASLRTPENTNFYTGALALWKIKTNGAEPSITWRTVMSYDASRIITTIISQPAAQKILDRQYIRDQLHNETFQAVPGMIKFDNRGHRNNFPGVMVTVQPKPTSAKELEFVPIAP